MVLLEINILKKKRVLHIYRYAPTKQISVYNRNTNKLLFTGTVGECAKFLGVKPYIINNALRKDNMGVFKFIVINDKIE